MWQKETEALRKILISCNLIEEKKWGKPCFSYEGGNIAIIQGFKSYFALLFFKGALLKDAKTVLVKMGENTNVGRQMRFTSVKKIEELRPTLKKYIQEAIKIEQQGLKVDLKEKKLVLPEEFQTVLNKDPAVKKAFMALTPGRQRAYNIYFSSAKQSKTREARIEKCKKLILKGKGLND
jgi:uncharacterized protein YdeI (YjbR/CyaY-like superfamily)